MNSVQKAAELFAVALWYRVDVIVGYSCDVALLVRGVARGCDTVSQYQLRGRLTAKCGPCKCTKYRCIFTQIKIRL